MPSDHITEMLTGQARGDLHAVQPLKVFLPQLHAQ